MIARALALVGGLAGGGLMSQFPEFSQQYLQRLGGAVEALDQVVADFDASAAASDLTRQQALEQMKGAEFLERRRTDMERTFKRHDVLRGDLAALRDAGPYERAFHAARFTDPEVASATRADFKPALPLTTEGAVFAGTGFVAGWGGVAAILGALGWAWRRVRRPAAPQPAPVAPPPPPDAARGLRRSDVGDQ